LWAAYGGKGDG